MRGVGKFLEEKNEDREREEKRGSGVRGLRKKKRGDLNRMEGSLAQFTKNLYLLPCVISCVGIRTQLI